MRFLIIMILYLLSPIFIFPSEEDYSLSPKELKDVKPFNDLSSKGSLDNETNKDKNEKQKEIEEFIARDEELKEGPKATLKLHIAPTYQFSYNVGEALESEEPAKNSISLPGARIGVSGSLASIDYLFITKFDDFQIGVLLANIKLNFLDKKFFFKLGKYRPFLVREFTSRGDFLFTSPAAIYDSVLKDKNEFYPSVLGGQFGINFLDRKINLYISLWMNDSNPNSEEFSKKYSTGFRFQYDIHKPWKHGKEIFDKETPLNLTLGLSGAFIYQEYEGVNLESIDLGETGEASLWLGRNGLRMLFDIKAKAHFFLFVAALASNFYLKNYYVGVHFDFGFYTTDWLLIALRYSFRNDYLGLKEKTQKENAIFINYPQSHGLGLTANFYPIKVDKTFSRNFKIQTVFEYFPKSIDTQILQLSIGAVLDF